MKILLRTGHFSPLTPPWCLQGSRKLLVWQDNGLPRGKGRWVQAAGWAGLVFLLDSINRGSSIVPAFIKKSFSLVHRALAVVTSCPADGQGGHRDSQLDLPVLHSTQPSPRFLVYSTECKDSAQLLSQP